MRLLKPNGVSLLVAKKFYFSIYNKTALSFPCSKKMRLL